MIEKAKEDYFDGGGKGYYLDDVAEKLNQVIDLLNKHSGEFENAPQIEKFTQEVLQGRRTLKCGCSGPIGRDICECDGAINNEEKGDSNCPHCPAQKKKKEEEDNLSFSDKVKRGSCYETNVLQWARELKQKIMEDIDNGFLWLEDHICFCKCGTNIVKYNDSQKERTIKIINRRFGL